MTAYVTIDMNAIELLRNSEDPDVKRDALPDTKAALKALGFKPKKRQGRIFELWNMIRGDVDEDKIQAIRKIPFVFKARIAGKGRYPSDRK